jgi:hypothetical protein
MERKALKDKYNEYYKEFKKKELYQLSQFDKLFILVLEIAEDINKLTPTATNASNTNALTNKTLEIKFNNSNVSDVFTLPSTNALLITAKSDKNLTVNLQLAYVDNKWVDSNWIVDIPVNTNLVVTDFSDYSGLINRKDSCRLVSNETITATYLMYYV